MSCTESESVRGTPTGQILGGGGFFYEGTRVFPDSFSKTTRPVVGYKLLR